MRQVCPICKKISSVKIKDWDAYLRWKAGGFIQDVFPDMTAGQRETLMSGSHEECFDKAFPEEA